MEMKQQLVINLDDIADDAEVLGKLYECGSLMVQSSNPDEVRTGYQMLEVVDRQMRELREQPALDDNSACKQTRT